jgi:hypothetical protein
MNSSFLGRPLSVQMLSARTSAVLSKLKFNGVDGTQAYFGFNASKHQSEGDVP